MTREVGVVINEWTGVEAAALRRALRLSIVDFAARLGVSGRTVSLWESAGRAARPRPFTQGLLDTALRRADDDARLRFVAILRESGQSPGSLTTW